MRRLPGLAPLSSGIFIIALVFVYRDFLFGDTLYMYTQAGYGGDDYRAYFPAFMFFNDWIKDPGFYSLRIGGGESVFAWANLLIDPFNWPLFVVDKAWIPSLILYLQMLKHLCIAVIGYCWLRALEYEEVVALAGAICLASVPSILSPHYQFVSYYFFTLLYLWALEIWFRNRGAGLLVLCLSMIAIFSMYMLYKLALFTGLYIIGRAVVREVSVRDFFRSSIHLLAISVLVILVAAPLIIPTVELVLNNPRTDANFSSLQYLSKWVYYRELVLSAMGVGPAALLALPAIFFLNARVAIVAAFGLLCLALFSSNVWFISLTTGFAKQTEFYMNFLFAIPIVLGVCYTLSRRAELASTTGMGLSLLMAVGFYVYPDKGDDSFRVLFLGATLLFVTLLLCQSKHRFAGPALLAMVAGFQIYWIASTLSSQAATWPMLKATALGENTPYGRLRHQQDVGHIDCTGAEPTRSKKTYTVTGLDDSLLFGYCGAEIYNSLINPMYMEFANHYFQMPTTPIHVVNSRPEPELDAFMGVRTFISDGVLPEALGLKEKSSHPGLKIYTLDQARSFGLFIRAYMDSALLNQLTGKQRLWQLHNAVVTDREFQGMHKLSVEDIPQIATPAPRAISVKFQVVQQNASQVVYQIALPEEARNQAISLGLRFKTPQSRFLHVIGVDTQGNQVNALAQTLPVARDAVKSPVWLQGNARDFVVNLQYYDYAQLVLVLNGSENEALEQVFLALVPLKPVQESVAGEEEYASLDFEFVSDGDIQGKITNRVPGMLVLQIPYRAGWRLLIDGESDDIHIVNHGLIGVHVDEAGTWDIRLYYRPQYWTLSFALSIMGLMLSFFYWRFWKLSATA